MNRLEFLKLIWGDSTGKVYLPYKKSDGTFIQQFVTWPNSIDKIEPFLDQVVIKGYNSYYTPVLLKETEAKKENFQQSNVVWVEFDGNAPKDAPQGAPEPSIRVQSSLSGREHWYWLLDKPCTSITQLEQVNRHLAYLLKADKSGWDAIQLLRPVGTKNFKYDEPLDVKILEVNENRYSIEDLAPKKAEIPDSPKITSVGQLPNVKDVTAKIPKSWQEANKDIFKLEEGERSDRLYAIYRDLSEWLTFEEIVSFVLQLNKVIKKWPENHALERSQVDIKRTLKKTEKEKAQEIGAGLIDEPKTKSKSKKEPEIERRIETVNLGQQQIIPLEWLLTYQWCIGLNVIVGEKETGKSTFLAYLAHKASTGDTTGIYSGKKLNVGYLYSSESSEQMVIRRMLAYGNTLDRIKMYKPLFKGLDGRWYPDSINLKEHLISGALQNWLIEEEIKVLIIDPHTAFIGEGKEALNSSNTIRSIFGPLQSFAEREKICLIVAGHPSKASQSSGSISYDLAGGTALVDMARVVWRMNKRHDDDTNVRDGSHLGISDSNDIPQSERKNYIVRIEEKQIEGQPYTFPIIKTVETTEDVYDAKSAVNAHNKKVVEGKRKAGSRSEAIITYLRLKNGVALASEILEELNLNRDARRSCTDKVGTAKLGGQQSKNIWFLIESFPQGAEQAIAAYNQGQTKPATGQDFAGILQME